MDLYLLAGQMLAEAQTAPAPTVNVKAIGIGWFLAGLGAGWIANGWQKANRQTRIVIIAAIIAIVGLLLALSAAR